MEGRRVYVFAALPVVAAATLLWFLISWAAPWNVQRWVGSVLVVVGVAFGGVARMIILGLILLLEKPVLWFGLAAVVGIQTIRARREARVLEEAFGDSYREYRRKTWF